MSSGARDDGFEDICCSVASLVSSPIAVVLTVEGVCRFEIHAITVGNCLIELASRSRGFNLARNGTEASESD